MYQILTKMGFIAGIILKKCNCTGAKLRLNLHYQMKDAKTTLMKNNFLTLTNLLFWVCIFSTNWAVAQCKVKNIQALTSGRNSENIVLTWDGCSNREGYQVLVEWQHKIHTFNVETASLLLTPAFFGDDLNNQQISFSIKQNEGTTESRRNCPTIVSFRIHAQKVEGERRKGNVIASIEDVYHPTEVSKLNNDCVTEGSVLAYVKTYPNPMEANLIVRYALIDESVVTLSITDYTGKEIIRLTDEETQSKGVYERTFDASQLPNGTYFYFLQADKERTIGKLIKF
jgi:hypothetical protein